MNCTSATRIHRLGNPTAGRHVIPFFKDYREKQAVLKNAGKLKGTEISLQNDYCADTLRKRRLLWSSAKEHKGNGKKLKLIHDKISIEDDLYFWDDAQNTRKLISKRKSNAETRSEHAV